LFQILKEFLFKYHFSKSRKPIEFAFVLGSVSPATAPWRKGLSFEMMDKVTELVKSLDGAFTEQEVCNTLRNNHFDISRTREELLGTHS
jgi:hypothetical protein